MMTNDVEKRWRSPVTGRRAGWYAGAVVVLALVAMAIGVVWSGQRSACAAEATRLCDSSAITAAVAVPATILVLGGIGAFVQTFRVWRRGGTWPIWQGAGWALFVLALLYLAVAMQATS